MRRVREVLHLRTAGVGLNEVAPARPRIPDLKPALRLRRDTDPRTPALPLQASIRLRLGRRFVSVVNLMHDGGLIAPLPRLRWLTIFTDLTESGMVQSFAACGFAAEPVTAAWLSS